MAFYGLCPMFSAKHDTHTYIHTRTSAHTHIYTHAQVHTHIYTHTHKRTHTYIHTRTSAHTHIYTRARIRDAYCTHPEILQLRVLQCQWLPIAIPQHPVHQAVVLLGSMPECVLRIGFPQGQAQACEEKVTKHAPCISHTLRAPHNQSRLHRDALVRWPDRHGDTEIWTFRTGVGLRAAFPLAFELQGLCPVVSPRPSVCVCALFFWLQLCSITSRAHGRYSLAELAVDSRRRPCTHFCSANA